MPIGLAGSVAPAALAWPCPLALDGARSRACPRCLSVTKGLGNKGPAVEDKERPRECLAWSLGPGVRVMEIFFGVGAGDTLTPTPSATQPSLVGRDLLGPDSGVYCAVLAHICLPNTPCILPGKPVELGALVSILPAEEPAIPQPRLTARCRVEKNVRIQKTSKLPAQDVSTDSKIYVWSSKPGPSCTRAHLQLAFPIPTARDARRLVSDLLQVRSGRAPNGALPSTTFFPLSVFDYRFCDSDRSTLYAQKSTGSHSMLGQSVSIRGNAPSLYWSWSSLARLGAAT